MQENWSYNRIRLLCLDGARMHFKSVIITLHSWFLHARNALSTIASPKQLKSRVSCRKFTCCIHICLFTCFFTCCYYIWKIWEISVLAVLWIFNGRLVAELKRLPVMRQSYIKSIMDKISMWDVVCRWTVSVIRQFQMSEIFRLYWVSIAQTNHFRLLVTIPCMFR